MPSRREMSRAKTALSLAIPALGALAADPLVSLVDTAFVGRLGPAQLGALGVCASVFGLAFFVFNFLATGTTPLVADAVGRGDRSAASRVTMSALSLAVVAGVGAALVLELAAEPILSLMGASGELRAPALAYLRVRALAAPAVLLVTVGHGVFRGYHDTRTPLWVTLGLNLVNLALDPLLIFGLGWGIAGAAWATTLAQWAGALVFVWLLLFRARETLGIERAWPRLADVTHLARVGGALALRTLSLLLVFTYATAVAARLGTLDVAAHQVAAQIWLFLSLVVDALAVAGQALVGSALGRGDRAEARHVANMLLRWGLGLGLALAALFALLAHPLPRLFTDEADVIARVGDVYVFVVVSQPIGALVFVWDGLFQGAQDFRFLAVQMIASALTACGILALVLPMGWGLNGVWWAMLALLVARALTLGWRYWLGGGPLRA